MPVQTVTPPRISPSTYSPLNKVWDEANKVIDFPDVWMATPNERLGFKRPDEVVVQYGEKGEDLVLNVIKAIGEGVFV